MQERSLGRLEPERHIVHSPPPPRRSEPKCPQLRAVSFTVTAADTPENAEDTVIAKSLAAMLSAGLIVISRNQDLIDNPDIGAKGLDGKSVLAQVEQLFRETTGSDPGNTDPAVRYGRLLRVEMNAIVDVMNAHQRELNQRGIGFKGFIPATFGRLVTESFGKSAAGEAEIKITAPPELIRNRRARPDDWEASLIRDKLLSTSWPKGERAKTGWPEG